MICGVAMADHLLPGFDHLALATAVPVRVSDDGLPDWQVFQLWQLEAFEELLSLIQEKRLVVLQTAMPSECQLPTVVDDCQEHA